MGDSSQPASAAPSAASAFPRPGAGTDVRLQNMSVIGRAADYLTTSPEPDVAACGYVVGAWVRDGAPVSLDAVLNIRSRGGVSTRRAQVIAGRDRLLRILADEHPEWAGLDPIVIAPRMAKAFETYEANRWPRDRDRQTQPLSEPAATFWRLLRDGQRMPQPKQLRTILAREIQYPV